MKVLALFSILLALVPALAGETSLTLDAATAEALEHNPEIRAFSDRKSVV